MKIVRIVSKKAGRRRAGIAHPDTAVDHPADRFTAAQLTQLKADRMLVVQEMEVEDKKADAKSAPSGGQGGKSGQGSGSGKAGS